MTRLVIDTSAGQQVEEDVFYLIANTRATVAKVKYRHQPNWVLVRDMFGCGATKAWEICKAAGIDGDSRKVERAA